MPKGSSDCYEIVVAMLSGFMKKIHSGKSENADEEGCIHGLAAVVGNSLRWKSILESASD